MLLNDLIKSDNVLNVYLFGSHLYKSNNSNSDYDYIVVCKEYFEVDDINVHVYTVEQFKLLLDRHDIQALECFFAAKEFKLKNTIEFKLSLDKSKLRTSISTITSTAWVKGKKKLIVAGDYDEKLALKSIFHSLRILDFGIQIASSGKIENFSSMNYILEDLFKMSKSYKREELWLKIEEKYKKLYNSKSSEFKVLAPKDLTEIYKKVALKKLLEKYHIEDNDLLEELMSFDFK